MLTHIVRNEELWDAFVIRNGGGFLQSWGWAKFQEALGRTVYRYRIDEEGQGDTEHGQHEDTVAQFMLVLHPLPFGKRYAYVPRGPILRWETAERARFQTFVGVLREVVRRERALFARIEFPFERGTSRVSDEEIREAGFLQVRNVQPADTSIVDLTKSEEDLLAEMHPKTRYNIRLAERHGVEVRDAEYGNAHLFRNDVELFWRMLGETASRDSFHTHPREYYATMLDVLSPKKAEGKLNVRLVFALHKGEAVAAAIVAAYGDTMIYLHGASLAAHRQVMAPYLLHWRLMQQARAAGFASYDFWGVAPTDVQDHPWAGITRFKRGFGGRRVGYSGAWELPEDQLWYTLYRYAKRFRNI